MYRIAILDSDRAARVELRNCLQKIMSDMGENALIKEYANGRQCLQESFDILFLEIELPDISGIEVKNKISRTNTALCFVSNHKEMMEHAFGKNVFGFLYKPISINKLKKVLGEMIGNNKCLVDRFGKKIRMSSILYIEAMGQYSTICCENNEIHFSGQPISEHEMNLKRMGFLRCHRKFVVNLSKVTQVQEHQVVIEGVYLPISRRRVCSFKKEYSLYLKEYSNWVESI